MSDRTYLYVLPASRAAPWFLGGTETEISSQWVWHVLDVSDVARAWQHATYIAWRRHVDSACSTGARRPSSFRSALHMRDRPGVRKEAGRPVSGLRYQLKLESQYTNLHPFSVRNEGCCSHVKCYAYTGAWHISW